MSMSDIFREANAPFRLDNLRVVDAEYFATLPTDDWDDGAPMTFDMWQDAMRERGFDPARITWNPDATMLRRFYYTGEYMSVELHHLNPRHLDLFPSTIENALGADEHWKRVFLEEKDYALYFFFEFNPFPMDYFQRHFDQIDEAERYEAFRSMYMSCEYGFGHLDRDLLERVFPLADRDATRAALEADGHTGETLTVYRGEGSLSTPYATSYSWTTSLKTAKWFATRFGEGRVYRATVKRDAVIDYIQERNESEVLVRPTDLERIKRIKV